MFRKNSFGICSELFFLICGGHYKVKPAAATERDCSDIAQGLIGPTYGITFFELY